MDLVHLILEDRQWERMECHLPVKPGDPGRRGVNNRLILEAVLWLARTGVPWRDLPAVFGKWNSVFTRFSRWSKDGVWDRLFGGHEIRSRLRIHHDRFDHCPGASTCGGQKGGLKLVRSGVRAAG